MEDIGLKELHELPQAPQRFHVEQTRPIQDNRLDPAVLKKLAERSSATENADPNLKSIGRQTRGEQSCLSCDASIIQIRNDEQNLFHALAFGAGGVER